MRGMVWSSRRVRALRLASCPCWASQGGMYACVFGLLFGAVYRVEGGGPGGGVMKGGVREVSPCCPCVQAGRGDPFRLYSVPLIVLAVGDEDIGGCQFVRFGGVGEVAGDGDLGGVVLADGGMRDDLVGSPLVLGGCCCLVQFEWGVEWFWHLRFFLGFRVRRYFGFDQASRAPGPGAPTWAAAAVAAWKRAVVLGSRGGGAPGWEVRVSWSWYAHQMV